MPDQPDSPIRSRPRPRPGAGAARPARRRGDRSTTSPVATPTATDDGDDDDDDYVPRGAAASVAAVAAVGPRPARPARRGRARRRRRCCVGAAARSTPGAPGDAVALTIPAGSTDLRDRHACSRTRASSPTPPSSECYAASARTPAPFQAGDYDGLRHELDSMGDVVERSSRPGPLPPKPRDVHWSPRACGSPRPRQLILDTFPEHGPGRRSTPRSTNTAPAAPARRARRTSRACSSRPPTRSPRADARRRADADRPDDRRVRPHGRRASASADASTTLDGRGRRRRPSRPTRRSSSPR